MLATSVDAGGRAEQEVKGSKQVRIGISSGCWKIERLRKDGVVGMDGPEHEQQDAK